MAAVDLEVSVSSPSAVRRLVKGGRRLVEPAGLLVWPLVLLVFGFALPLVLLIRASLAPSDGGGLWSDGWTLAAYGAAFDSVGALFSSVLLALAVAASGLLIAFPLSYLISRMARPAQTAWLIFVLVTLSLSDVLVAFSWQVMLSKRVGLSNLLVAIGVLDQPVSMTPSNGAVLSCLLYLAIPFSVVTLYPGLSRLDRSLIEAARTMGASPWKSFFTVVLPLSKTSLLTTFSLATVLTLGAYVAPMVLGHPQNWTMAILISRTVLSGQDLPQAAAMSMMLLAVTLGLIAFGRIVGRLRWLR